MKVTFSGNQINVASSSNIEDIFMNEFEKEIHEFLYEKFRFDICDSKTSMKIETYLEEEIEKFKSGIPSNITKMNKEYILKQKIKKVLE